MRFTDIDTIDPELAQQLDNNPAVQIAITKHTEAAIVRHGAIYDTLNDVPADIRSTVAKMGLKATANGEAPHVWADRMRTLNPGWFAHNTDTGQTAGADNLPGKRFADLDEAERVALLKSDPATFRLKQAEYHRELDASSG